MHFGGIQFTAVARTFRKPPDGHEIYALVGHVAAEWAHLEHLLDQTVWEASRMTQHEGQCVTGQIVGPAPRFFAIIALLLFHRIDKTLVDTTRNLMGSTNQIYEKRNRIVHDAWFIETGSEDVYQHKGMPRNELSRKSTEKLTLGIQSTYDTKAARETIGAIVHQSEKIAEFKTKVTDAIRRP